MIIKKGIILLILLITSTMIALIPTNFNPEEYYIDGVPLVDQGDTPWCGPASIAMVLGYWGNNISIEEIGQQIDSGKDGTCPREIIEYIESLYPVRQFNSSTDDPLLKESFKKLKNYIRKSHPVIISRWWKPGEGGHVCVVVGYDSQKIYVIDPHGHKDSFKYKYFTELWKMRNGLGIVIKPVDSDGDTVSNRSEEKQFKTDPLKWDTDGDGLSDGEEIKEYKTDPLKWDTDGDGLSDGEEIEQQIVFSSVFSPNMFLLILPSILILLIRKKWKEKKLSIKKVLGRLLTR